MKNGTFKFKETFFKRNRAENETLKTQVMENY